MGIEEQNVAPKPQFDILKNKALLLCRELQCPAMEYLNEHVRRAWIDLYDFLEGSCHPTPKG